MRELRRKEKQMERGEIEALLADSEYGVMSTVDGDGQPYGVPLNYVYQGGAVYFHCALNGHKLDNLAINPKVSFTVVGENRVLPDLFATNYVSVVAYGVASEVSDGERQDAIKWLLQKYSPGFLEEGKIYAKKHDRATRIVKIAVTHMSGKRSPAKE